MDKAADHKGDADVLGVIDNAALCVVGKRKLDPADELAVQKEEVRLVQKTKLPGDVVPVMVRDPGRVGADPATGPRVGKQEGASVVVRVPAARGTHETGDRDEPVLERAGASEAAEGKIPAPAHTGWEAQPFIFGAADIYVGVTFFEAARSGVSHPGFDRPLG